MKAYRAAILRFDAQQQAAFDKDGLLVVAADASGTERILAVGDHDTLIGQYAGVPLEHLPGRIIAPGFVDMHVHFPQIDVIG